MSYLDTGKAQAWYDVMLAISREIERQNKKWGEQNHDDLTWYAIMGEEFGEAAEQCIPRGVGGHVDEDHLEREVVQTVAVGLQWLMARKRREENGEPEDETLQALKDTLLAFERLIGEVNFRESALSADTIRDMNEIPSYAARIIRQAEEDSAY